MMGSWSRRARALSLAAAAVCGWSSAALAGDEDIEPAATSDWTLFSTPTVDPGTPAVAVTCYISNNGEKTVEIKDFRLFSAAGPIKGVATTCGDPKRFKLRPDASCYISAPAPDFQNLFNCAALSKNVEALRGSLEARSSDDTVLGAMPMYSLESRAKSNKDFEKISSANAFGSSRQTFAYCRFTNLGGETAKVRNVRLANTNGDLIPLGGFCEDKTGKAVDSLRSQGFCQYNFVGMPLRDHQCIAEVTRKADVRGTFVVRESLFAGEVFNQQPMR